MKKESIKRGSLVISSLNIIARTLGFISVFLVSYYLGANSNTDLYYFLTSFNALFSILFICLLPTVLMPIFIKTRVQSGEDSAWLFINSMFTYTLLLSIILSALFYYFSEFLLIRFSHFTYNQISNSRLVVILFAPIFVLTVVSEFLRFIIQAHNQFTFPSIILLLSNIFMIAGLMIGADKIGVLSMSIAVLVSLVFQCIILLTYIKKFSPLFSLSLVLPVEIKHVFQLSFPVLFAQVFASSSMFYYDYTSTLFTAGTLTAISFAQKIYSLPADMIVTPMSNVLSPIFSEFNARNELDQLTVNYIKYNGIIWYFIIPISLFIIFFSEPIIELLFFRGSFSRANVQTASLSLKIFSISLFGISYVSIYTRVLYAIQKTNLISIQATLISIISILITYLLSLNIGYLGIPLTRTLSILLLSFPQGIYLSYKYLAGFSFIKLMKSFITSSASALIAIICCIYFYDRLIYFIMFDNLIFLYLSKLSITFFLFISIYFIVSILIKTNEGIYFLKLFKDKFLRVN